jgi:hypothetical protein
MLYGAIYAGVRLGNEEALPWARLGNEFSPTNSHHYVTGSFQHSSSPEQSRRLSLRVIPQSWQDPTFQTPYIVEGVDGKLQLLHKGSDESSIVGEFDQLLPPDTPRTIAYLRENRHSGDNGVVINPIMTCPHRCQFCSRQYDILNLDVDKEGRVPTILFSPTEISRYIEYKYPDIEWENLNRISVVTGSFNTFEDMHAYLAALRGALYETSHGKFLSNPDSDQEILVLSHLARTEEEFRRLRELGVTLQDTVEILDDGRRKEFMKVAHKDAAPKYVFDQKTIIQSMKHAIKIFGEDDYRATLILGLDDSETTLEGFEAMQEAGLRKLYYPVFQPYGTADHELYQMSFAELLQARQVAHQMFNRVY